MDQNGLSHEYQTDWTRRLCLNTTPIISTPQKSARERTM